MRHILLFAAAVAVPAQAQTAGPQDLNSFSIEQLPNHRSEYPSEIAKPAKEDPFIIKKRGNVSVPLTGTTDDVQLSLYAGRHRMNNQRLINHSLKTTGRGFKEPNLFGLNLQWEP